jgi:hypothetical protein
VVSGDMMRNPQSTFGIPNTLPALGLREVRHWLWLAFTGLLLLALGLFPHLIPAPWGGLLVLAFWLALPVRGLFMSKPTGEGQKRVSTQTKFYTLIMVSFGVGFTLWARYLGLPWSTTIGALFFIEALPSIVVSLTEWWRLSSLGLSLGLAFCGLGFPFAKGNTIGILLGASVLFGGTLSACILYWQVRRHENSD